MNDIKLVQRLLKNSTLDPTTSCWIWNKSITKWGYGSINVGGKIELAHRVSYRTLNTPFDPQLCVCHACDNPACINPEHLWIGTNLDNVKDKVKKGRQGRAYKNRGQDSPQAKLSDNEILEIRASTLSQTALAKQYHTTQSNISQIVNRVRWTHI